jgi:hypothetical protein
MVDLTIPDFLLAKNKIHEATNFSELKKLVKSDHKKKQNYKKTFIKSLPKAWAKADVTMINIYWHTRGDCGYRMVAYRTITKGKNKGKIAYRTPTNNTTYFVIAEVFFKFKQEEIR